MRSLLAHRFLQRHPVDAGIAAKSAILGQDHCRGQVCRHAIERDPGPVDSASRRPPRQHQGRDRRHEAVQSQEHGEHAFSGVGKKRADESRVAELERKVGQQAMEIDFLKRALQHVEEQRLLRALNNGAPSTSRSKKK